MLEWVRRIYPTVFNISVGVTDDFMEALQNGEEFTFTNSHTEEPHITTEETKELYEMFGLGDLNVVAEELSVSAEELWDDIVESVHENGEFGVFYLLRVNKQHSSDVEKHTDHRILATNPCGEQSLEGTRPVTSGTSTSRRSRTSSPDDEDARVRRARRDGLAHVHARPRGRRRHVLDGTGQR